MKPARLLKIVGLSVDILGGLLIASSVLFVNGKRFSQETLPMLEKDIDNAINRETKLTISGMSCLVVGFVMLLVSEFKLGW